ncbi:MAG: type II toxin-antitoxin system VapC family toxin [Verrucomicrobia bacterium]|nr:type II toxin-antitoxin system VapC family toxin [Verrucomicrobiota bacterium]MCH8528915.1 type II toxin-antitoxin system VapC family toxin [Kiritimatiellia bacterium]
MGLILDTSALVALERCPDLWMSGGIPSEELVVLPAIVWAEALAGVRLADSVQRAARRLARLEAIRKITRVHPFTDEIAEQYADIFSDLHKRGEMIPQNDIQVAATARFLGFAVLVGQRDEVHFRRVQDLNVRVL